MKELVVHASDDQGGAGPIVGRAFPGGSISGLVEDTAYLLRFSEGKPVHVCIDDVRLQPHYTRHDAYTWRPDFYAGRVGVSVRFEATNSDVRYHLDVSPNPQKLGDEIYRELLSAVRRADQRMALGLTPATAQFSNLAEEQSKSPVVALERMRKYGPQFIKALRDVSTRPHRKIRPQIEHRPLSVARRIAPASLRDPKLLLRVESFRQHNGAQADEVSVLVRSFETTADTAANRTLKALVNRFLATAKSLKLAIHDFEMGGEKEQQHLRQTSRLESLNSLINQAEGFLKALPLAEVRKPETSAAGLTQIAAQPVYARCFRLGCQALRIGVYGDDGDDDLPITQSWELYERWCFLELVSELETSLGKAPRLLSTSAFANADRIVAFDIDSGRQLQLLYQAKFPSIVATQGGVSTAWSVSRERYPDIVAVLGSKFAPARFAVIDAKYRAGRQNILDAMGSAHIYRDALRLGEERAAFALLTLPGEPWSVHLDSPECWAKHMVGTVSECRPGAGGIQKVADWLLRWVRSFETSQQHAS